MTSTEKTELSFGELSLEPLPDSGYLPIQTGPAKIHPNSRTKADRRVNTADRRQVLRFEKDRRSGKARRPQSVWDSGMRPV